MRAIATWEVHVSCHLIVCLAFHSSCSQDTHISQQSFSYIMDRSRSPPPRNAAVDNTAHEGRPPPFAPTLRLAQCTHILGLFVSWNAVPRRSSRRPTISPSPPTLGAPPPRDLQHGGSVFHSSFPSLFSPRRSASPIHACVPPRATVQGPHAWWAHERINPYSPTKACA